MNSNQARTKIRAIEKRIETGRKIGFKRVFEYGVNTVKVNRQTEQFSRSEIKLMREEIDRLKQILQSRPIIYPQSSREYTLRTRIQNVPYCKAIHGDLN